MKICKKCGEEKPLQNFAAEKRNKDGLNGTCRSCINARFIEWAAKNKDKRRAYYESNRDKILAENAAYYQKNSDRIKQKAKQYRHSNADKVREYHREYATANAEKARERVKSWRLANKDRKKVHNQNRRALKKASGGIISGNITTKLMSLQKRKCAVCKSDLRKTGYHLDHILPLTLGAPNIDNNIQLLCPKCNVQKHNIHPIDFMQRKGFLL